MTDQQRPVVVIVDDDADQSTFADSLDPWVEAVWRHPLDIDDDDLVRATLLAVDEKFDLRGSTPPDVTPLPAGLPPSTVPRDGLALAAVLRSACKSPDLGRPRPIGIALRTGALHELTAHLPHAVRQPVVASQHDLEWVLTKEPDLKDVGAPGPRNQLIALAQALHAYPANWPNSKVRDVGLRWIGVPQRPWSNVARRQILQSRPPAQVSADAAHGLSWLRWLTTHVLPYPGFLISDHHVAAALGLTPSSFTEAMRTESWLSAQLSSCIYEGPLRELQARRFWRAGISAFIASIVDDLDVEDTQIIADQIISRDERLEPAGLEEPVVGVDADYYPLPNLIERAAASRLAPDYWPAYADSAWTDQSLAATPEMKDLLAPKTR